MRLGSGRRGLVFQDLEGLSGDMGLYSESPVEPFMAVIQENAII